MPRPKTIEWEKRVSVFLAYRRNGGKVNPVANHYGIARSTVNVIVKEFEDMGFAGRPRAKVSPALLTQMQEQHLRQVMGHKGVGHLSLGPGTDDETGRQVAAADPLPVQEELAWHLKGTKAEQVISEVTNAARDYLLRESEAWRELRLDLEEICGLPEREDKTTQDPEAYLLPSLKRRLHNTFFDRAFQKQPPPPSWLEWDVVLDNARVLLLQRQEVAIGDAADHLRIKQGVASFLAHSFREHQRRFLQIERLRRDLGIMQEIVNQTLGSIEESDVRRGICPACPYPEARLEPDGEMNGRKRRGKEKGQYD
jgi:transposase